MKLIHKFKQNDYNFLLDVNSGSVHLLDDVAYDVLDFYEKDDLLGALEALKDYSRADIEASFEELKSLEEEGTLLSEDIFPQSQTFKGRNPVVKAMCLHMAHDCNLKCKYCFAGQGEFNGPKELMSFEVGKKAIDYLIKNSKNRRNLEIDFFGGEPLMNFEVVKELVEYGNSEAQKYNKNFRFTITTNGILLDDAKIDYINAHSTSTGVGDAAELAGIGAVFENRGKDLSISSTKSATGHLMGAAGAIESVFSILALRDGVVPPTRNLDDPDVGDRFDLVPKVAKLKTLRHVLSNSFGFGGVNASLVISAV